MSPDVHAYIDEHRENALADYKELISIPSISALSAHDPDTRRAAEFVAKMLRESALENVRIIEPESGEGAPLVYGDWLHAEEKPTVLIYAHYDVQPVDPIDLWDSPPFEPTIKGDLIYGRGVTDDKKNTIITIHAVAAMLDSRKALPVNVRFIFEGEEESGGEVIEAFVKAHPEELASDITIIADGGMVDMGHGTVHYGIRGMLYTEISAKGAAQDLHSGGYGGVAPNPIFGLAQIITGLKDNNGFITIPGLYELMEPLGAGEKDLWAKLPFDIEAKLSDEMGTEGIIGEENYIPYERLWARPTLEVHGIIGGFQDEGTKTVIPAEAKAKVSLRLVPGQTPENVLPLLQQRVKEVTPPLIKSEVTVLGGGLSYVADVESPAFRAACQALEDEFGGETRVVRTGGSIPITAVMAEKIGGDIFIIGFGLEGDGAHSPNEHTSLTTFYQGLHAFVRILDALGDLPK